MQIYMFKKISAYWFGAVVFLFVYSSLALAWDISSPFWSTDTVNVVNTMASLLIAGAIGAHLSLLTTRPTQWVHLLYALFTGYMIFRLYASPPQDVVGSQSWASWLAPRTNELPLLAVVAILCGTVLHNNHWLHRITSLFLLGVIAIISTQYLVLLVYLILTIGLCLLVTRKQLIVPRHQQKILSRMPVVYATLFLAAITTLCRTPFNNNEYHVPDALICAVISLVVMQIAASNVFLQCLYWLMDWLNWVTGQNPIEEYQPSEQFKNQCKIIYNWYKQWLHKPVLVSISLVCTLALVLLIIELPLRQWSIDSTITWANSSLLYLAISVGTFFSIYCVLRTFLSRLAASLMLMILVALISATNFLKLLYLNVPMVPSDLNMIDQAVDSLEFIAGKNLTFTILAGFFFIAALFAWSIVRYSQYMVNKNPWIGLRGLISLLSIIWLMQPGKWSLTDHVPNAWETGNSTRLYLFAGFTPGFLYRYQQFYIRPPQNFSNTSTLELAASLNLNLHPTPSGQLAMPHIIAIQSEAFWDPGLLHENLFPRGSPGNLRTICEAPKNIGRYCQSGYVEVPTFGGTTANSEFEFLTGLSMHLLPPGTTPFVHYIHKPTPSLAWRLKQANYHTVGVHPNERTFWNRDKVYPLLGFQEFEGIESFNEVPTNKLYVSDQALNSKIIPRIKLAQQPQFIFAVSMANHAPFADQRYDSLEDEVINWEHTPHLTTAEHQILKTYSIGVRESRRALAELIDTFNEPNSPPVIIVFYGDHLPILGELYNKFGFSPTSIYDLFQELFSTPYLVWSNQPLTQPLPSSLPVSLLGQNTLELAGLGKSGIHQMLTELQNSHRLRRPSLSQITNNEPQPILSDQQNLYFKTYVHANFDALFNQKAMNLFGITPPLVISQLKE